MDCTCHPYERVLLRQKLCLQQTFSSHNLNNCLETPAWRILPPALHCDGRLDGPTGIEIIPHTHTLFEHVAQEWYAHLRIQRSYSEVLREEEHNCKRLFACTARSNLYLSRPMSIHLSNHIVHGNVPIPHLQQQCSRLLDGAIGLQQRKIDEARPP
jgi:hypothetical protein